MVILGSSTSQSIVRHTWTAARVKESSGVSKEKKEKTKTSVGDLNAT
jgi:hypothetical protein